MSSAASIILSVIFLQNVRFILSCVTDTPAYSAIKSRQDSKLFEVKSLDVLDKAALVKESLARHGKQLDESPFNNQVQLVQNTRNYMKHTKQLSDST